MRRKLISISLLVLLLSLPPSYSLQEERSYYLYFNNMLDLTEKTLSGVLLGNASLSDAEYLLRSAVLTYRTLSSYGSSQNLLKLASAFVNLERGAFLIVNSSSAFGELSGSSSSQRDLANAIQGISLARSALMSISETSFSEGNTTYVFDTSKLMAVLDTLSKMLKRNEVALGKSLGEKFVIFASTDNPFVGENVTIIGYAPNMTNVTLFINGSYVMLSTREGRFSYVFSPKLPGVYRIYAVGSNSTGEYRSNVLLLNVDRIPVTISLSTNVNGSMVYGSLIDARGRPLSNATVLIRWGLNYTEVWTDGLGRFFLSINVTSPTWVDALYFGDETHLPASASVELVPLRIPLLIKLVAKVPRGSDEAIISGRISPEPGELLMLKVYVDGHLYSFLYTSTSEFTLRIPLGDEPRKVYVVFPGDSRYLPSRSNTVTVSPPEFPTSRLVLLGGLLVVLMLIYRRLEFGHKTTSTPSGQSWDVISEKQSPQIHPLVFRSIRDLYRFIHPKLLRVSALPPSTTPRELLRTFRGTPFYRELSVITRLHELEVYGRVKLGVRWFERGLRAVSRVVLSIVIGDEL